MSCRQDEELADIEARATAGERRAAKEQGGAAFVEGLSRDACPFGEEGVLASSWRAGWAQAADTAARVTRYDVDIEF